MPPVPSRLVLRIGIMLVVALPLAAADLFVKATMPTEPWAYHQRSLGWLVLSVSLLVGLVAIARIPSVTIALAAGVLAAGILGNSLSAAWNDMVVPNPLLAGSDEQGLVAFNLADLWVIAGIILLVLTISLWLVRNRALIPAPAEIRETRGRAFGRLFD